MTHDGNRARVLCPNCRGPGTILATWNYVGDPRGHPPTTAPSIDQEPAPVAAPEPEEPVLAPAVLPEDLPPVPEEPEPSEEYYVIRTPTPPDNPGSDYETPHGTPDPWYGVWWKGGSSETALTDARTFSSNVHLPDGRLGLLIDTGVWGNLQGEVWCKHAAAQARTAGHEPEQKELSEPMSVNGVGAGSQRAVWQATIPTALTRSDGTIGMTTFTAPVVEGADLPPLLGLRSLKANRVILDLVKNELIMCGPGDCKIEPPPGSETYPLEHTPSGHLVLPISAYAKYRTQRNPQDTVTALHAQRQDQPASPSSAAHLADPEPAAPRCPDFSS